MKNVSQPPSKPNAKRKSKRVKTTVTRSVVFNRAHLELADKRAKDEDRKFSNWMRREMAKILNVPVPE